MASKRKAPVAPDDEEMAPRCREDKALEITESEREEETRKKRERARLAAPSYASQVAVGTLLFLASMILAFRSFMLLWKGSIVNVGTYFLTNAALALAIAVPCCSSSCRSSGFHRAFVLGPLAGFLLVVMWAVYLFNTNFRTVMRPDFDLSKPVAVVGSGASGLAAAWMLARSGRKVVILESTDDIGGHSKVWPRAPGEGHIPVDLGYIFNGKYYGEYRTIADYLEYKLIPTALNTSGVWNGQYWDNTRPQGSWPQKLEDDIDKFDKFRSMEKSTMRMLTPLGLFLWWHGFSEDFLRLCLNPTMTVLFVTKMGLLRQSAQGVLNHFSGVGFSHLRYDHSKVWYNSGGSQNMWHDWIRDMNTSGLVEVKLNSAVDGMLWENEAWSLQLSNGRKLPGFSNVILAIPANRASQLLHNPLHRLVLGQIDYVSSWLTLHTNSALLKQFAKAGDNVLYFVNDQAMTGKIGKIFGNASSELLLSVHEDKHIIDAKTVKVQYQWSHHYFSLWELVVAKKFLPLFNHRSGIHIAGDWTEGIGHNDAIVAGIKAACEAGIVRTGDQLDASERAKRAYDRMLHRCG